MDCAEIRPDIRSMPEAFDVGAEAYIDEHVAGEPLSPA
jgi:hypothetical protein